MECKLLSFGGKSLWLNTLSAVPVYMMLAANIPKMILKHIEKLLKDLFGRIEMVRKEGTR